MSIVAEKTSGAQRMIRALDERDTAYIQRCRAIDAILREDARKHPAFATARRAGALAAYETTRNLSDDAACAIVGSLRLYEEVRGGARKPSPDGIKRRDAREAGWADVPDAWTAALTHYERARSLP